MKIHYYPGCTLKDKAVHFESSTLRCAEELGLELKEVPNWTCCGGVYPLSEEKISNLIAPIRVLREVRDDGGDKVTTLCAFCYSALKRANRAILDDELKYKRINAYLKDDIRVDENTKEKRIGFEEYEGNVKTLHFLEVLRDMVGFDTIKEKVERDVSYLSVAPYYGCTLLRPFEEINLDDPESPKIFDDFLESLGCNVVDYPFKGECCGSYLSLSSEEAALNPSYNVLKYAKLNGADLLVLTCPLCLYNLDEKQDKIKEKFSDFTDLPVLYFTQLLAWALGVEEDTLGFDKSFVDPKPLFK